jgi:hypothetical protein
MNRTELTDFGTRYAAAWSSQNPVSLASFYNENGSLTVNGGAPSVGRTAITDTGPGGTGKSVRITGYEEWTIGPDDLIAESKGHYDEAEYQRQLESGAPPRS